MTYHRCTLGQFCHEWTCHVAVSTTHHRCPWLSHACVSGVSNERTGFKGSAFRWLAHVPLRAIATAAERGCVVAFDTCVHAEEGEEEVKEEKPSMIQVLITTVLKNPYIWGMALTYFFIYVIRQGVTSWCAHRPLSSRASFTHLTPAQKFCISTRDGPDPVLIWHIGFSLYAIRDK